ncbi:insulinase family protein [Vibrio metschnikovii]
MVSQATVAQLRDLYQRFYTPERTTIIIVGDIDIAATERQIQQGFSNWQPHPQAIAVSEDPLPKLTVQTALRADGFFDPRLPTTVTLEYYNLIMHLLMVSLGGIRCSPIGY